jgi:hypothetical protein
VKANQWQGMKTTNALEPSTPEKLRKSAQHVSYEIRMLIFSAQHVSGWHASPLAPLGADEKQSFLLHFRNLRAFL